MGHQLINNNKLNIIKYENIPSYFKALGKPRLRGRENSSETGDINFTGTRSFEESYNLMVKGDKESYDMVVRLKKITDAMFEYKDVMRPKPQLSVEGYQPHIPNAIRGLPNSMIAKKPVKTQKKVVDIFYNSSLSWNHDPENLAYRGALLLSAIQTLETKGYSVNLYVGEICMYNDKYIGHVIKLKSAVDRLNIFKSAFYLVNPSFLRRISFKINEVEEDLIDVTNAGYGRATTEDDFDDLFKTHIFDNSVIFDSRVDININNESSKNLKALKTLLGGRL